MTAIRACQNVAEVNILKIWLQFYSLAELRPMCAFNIVCVFFHCHVHFAQARYCSNWKTQSTFIVCLQLQW